MLEEELDRAEMVARRYGVLPSSILGYSGWLGQAIDAYCGLLAIRRIESATSTAKGPIFPTISVDG